MSRRPPPGPPPESPAPTTGTAHVAGASPGGVLWHPPPSWMARLTARLAENPPEIGAHGPPAAGGRASAVLMLFGPRADGGGDDVLLTERASGLRSHAGQISFPGGRVDPNDAGPESAAVREAAEEVDLDGRGVQIVTRLPDVWVPVSSSVVTPVLAWWARPSPVRVASTREVARVARVSVDELLDPARRFTVTHPNGYRGPGFEVGDMFVWGVTAGLLSAVFELAGLDRPWDASAMRELPARYSARRAPTPAPEGWGGGEGAP